MYEHSCYFLVGARFLVVTAQKKKRKTHNLSIKFLTTSKIQYIKIMPENRNIYATTSFVKIDFLFFFIVI